MEKAIKDALQHCLTELAHNTVVMQYKEAKDAVQRDDAIRHLEKEIEFGQKKAVQLNYYEKKRALAHQNKNIDDLYHQMDDNQNVQRFREQLYEANDLLHYIANRLENAVNKEEEHE